jgi:hypothetical protein
MGKVIHAKFGKPGALRFGMTSKQRRALAFISTTVEQTGDWPAMEDIQQHIRARTMLGASFVVSRLAAIGAVTLPEDRAGDAKLEP